MILDAYHIRKWTPVMLLLLLFSHYKSSRSLSPYLLLSQPLRTNPTLDSANFRGHRLTYVEKVYQNKMGPQGSAGR